MGRHRRATPTSAAPQRSRTPAGDPAAGTVRTPAPAPRYGRHRGARRRPAPVRSGLLGASAALAVGAVGVSSGLIPGPDGVFTVGDTGTSGRVQADGASVTPYGGTSGSPSDRASRGAERDGLRDGAASPSDKASKTPEEQKKEEKSAAPTKTAEPSDAPSRTGSPGGSASDGDETRSAPARTRSADPGTGGSGEGSGGGSSQDTSAEAQVLSLVNAERAKVGCSPVTADSELAALAEGHSRDMAERGYFSHTTPDGRSPWDRADAAGVDNMGGENIARGQSDAQAVMDAWMNSDGHRANILNCDFRTLGVGAHFAQGGPWWTQAFGY
ncbi:CAP domain-containing protein [Streptomyces sp. DSM 42041]|uniref:CAP domain-containing protein n=1 Tax=Streptomyces hazeniae TaxID=3075538 RepID=A0ABU2NP32_9ACTN|nr:CAP domain-containing protein [Streptomyces sp. DSM 42041]MDT0378729.1 CAP domain-containing protein [Streptomyces sp. DSM 42041]